MSGQVALLGSAAPVPWPRRPRGRGERTHTCTPVRIAREATAGTALMSALHPAGNRRPLPKLPSILRRRIMKGRGRDGGRHGMAWHGPGWLLQAPENSWPGAGTHQDVSEKTVLLDRQEPEMRRRLQKAGPFTSLSIVLPSSISSKGRIVRRRTN